MDGRETREGMTFNRLKAIEFVCKGRDRCDMWRFECVCGNVIVAPYTRVANGYTKSCGCQRSISARRQAISMIGERFGRLIVLARAGSNAHRAALWTCRCDCGKEITTSGNSLRKGVVNSCGCMKIEMLVRTAKSRALSKSDKEKSAERRRERARMSMRKRRREDPTFRLSQNTSAILRYALRRIGQCKAGRTFDILGYTPLELKNHIEKQFSRGMTWENMGQWEIDHIIPLCTAKTRSDILRLNQLSNLRPLWERENRIKNGRMTHLC